ncbi:MAG: hypothetical protein EHM21_17955, partial [Chloroflexi bacterium]
MKTQQKRLKVKSSTWPWLITSAAGALALAALLRRNPRKHPKPAAVQQGSHYNAVVIGSGFGGSMAGLTVARAMNERGRGEK